MPVADNPAGRLHNILSEAKQKSTSGSAFVGWGIVFGILHASENPSPEKEYIILQRLITVHDLIEDAEESIRAIDDIDHQLYLRPFPRVRQAIPVGAGLSGDFRSMLAIVTEGDMTILEFCSMELAKRHIEQIVDEDILANLLMETSDLFSEIEKAPLHKELRAFLLQQLLTIQIAIQEYRIGGAKRLRKALASIVGSLFVDGNVIKGESKKEEVSKFSKVFFAFVSLVEFASKTTPLIEPVAKVIGLLLPGKDVPPVDSSQNQ